MSIAKGIIADARPGQPQEPAYDTPVVVARDLDHKGRYDSDVTPGGIGLPMALHHVIPWNRLRDFWNAMQRNGYWSSMTVYGSMLGISQSDMARHTAAMQRSRFGNECGLDQYLCWAQWNLMRGPQHRSDDPEEDVDNLRSSYGRESDNDRIAALLKYGETMRLCLTRMPRESDVRDLINAMKAKLNRLGIMQFNPPIWHIGHDSPVFVPGTAMANPTYPTWCIRGRITK